jgi:signal transduction histidine kinase
MTEKDAFQDLKERYDVKSEFVSLMVHQLRTPLSALKWSIKMLLDGDLGELAPQQRDVLEKGYSSNERMIQLVNDILNVDKIEAGEMQFKFVPIDLQDVIIDVVSELTHVARENDMTLSFERVQGIPSIQGDLEKLRVVFQNLIDNAIKYSKKGGKIIIGVEEDGNDVVVRVVDAGIGIPEDERDKIFSKFFRSSNAREVKTEGSGLGLYIARVIIENHKGSITFESESGRGTTFFVRLPKEKVGD